MIKNHSKSRHNFVQKIIANNRSSELFKIDNKRYSGRVKSPKFISLNIKRQGTCDQDIRSTITRNDTQNSGKSYTFISNRYFEYTKYLL